MQRSLLDLAPAPASGTAVRRDPRADLLASWPASPPDSSNRTWFVFERQGRPVLRLLYLFHHDTRAGVQRFGLPLTGEVFKGPFGPTRARLEARLRKIAHARGLVWDRESITTAWRGEARVVDTCEEEQA